MSELPKKSEYELAGIAKAMKKVETYVKRKQHKDFKKTEKLSALECKLESLLAEKEVLLSHGLKPGLLERKIKSYESKIENLKYYGKTWDSDSLLLSASILGGMEFISSLIAGAVMMEYLSEPSYMQSSILIGLPGFIAFSGGLIYYGLRALK